MAWDLRVIVAAWVIKGLMILHIIHCF